MVFYTFIPILIEHSVSKKWKPDQTLRSAASGLGLHCFFSMSRKEDATLLHRALLTSFLCKQTSVTTLTVVRNLHLASIFNPGNPHIQKNQSYRLLHSVVDSTFVSHDVNVRNFTSFQPRKKQISK